MQSTYSSTAFLCLALILASSHICHSFQPAIINPNSRAATTELYGKRARIVKTVKKIFRDTEVGEVAVPEPDSNFPINGRKIKLSNDRAKDLAKKYEDIDDLGEKAFQILVDLKMV
mmetsp:Transcript_27948/g.75974  ORF Transcript_27948/g.75974 Transcript_27948/m.75974 type:complete len:116 (-) Transcript_27948:3062-3409(-)